MLDDIWPLKAIKTSYLSVWSFLSAVIWLFLATNKPPLNRWAFAFFSSDFDFFFHIKSFFESIFNRIYHQSVSVCVWMCFEGVGDGGIEVKVVGLIQLSSTFPFDHYKFDLDPNKVTLTTWTWPCDLDLVCVTLTLVIWPWPWSCDLLRVSKFKYLWVSYLWSSSSKTLFALY